MSFSLTYAHVNAEDINKQESKLTTINLKYITGEDVLSVLESLIDKSVSISEENDVLLINGTPDKTKNILHIINQIDTPPSPLTIEFIASNRKINFKQTSNTYQSAKNKNNASQSMAITERQWVTLNTGLSIPITERKRYADGTETQSFRYKKISKSYVFKVHEFSGWSVVQVGLNVSELSDDVAGAIAHTKLDTTIVGKTEEWLEVASSKPITEDEDSQTYSTNRINKNHIYLYVKVKKSKLNTESEPKITQ
jgi:hypothetical protein